LISVLFLVETLIDHNVSFIITQSFIIVLFHSSLLLLWGSAANFDSAKKLLRVGLTWGFRFGGWGEVYGVEWREEQWSNPPGQFFPSYTLSSDWGERFVCVHIIHV
jgi:hypothetical protein